MAKWSHKLPAVLNPVGDICVEITIPAHPDYVALFVRAVRMLEVNHVYERDELLSAKVVVDQWRNRTITPLIEALATGTGICGVDGECLAYPPFAGFITYSPQNPYTQPDFVPDGYELPPFYINGMDNEHDLPNYERGDVIVNFGAINLDVGFELENAPQIVLCLEGSGVVELKLLSIAQGGVVVITVDNPPDIFDILAGIISDDLLIVDLNQDIISLPPETATEIIQEITIETEGEHNIYLTFLPILDDSLIPLRFGGGLRAVDLCGNIRPCGTPAPEPPPPLEGVTELKPEFQFTADCGLEYRLRDQEDNIVQDWQGVPGWTDNAAACFGAGAMTPEEMCEAVECGIVKVAERILTGESGIGFTIGDNGEVIVGDGVVDDPETELNEQLSSRAGGAIAVWFGLQELLNNVYDWFNGGTISQSQAQTRLKNLYVLNEAAADAFVAYWYANGAGQDIISLHPDLKSMLFCKGSNVQTLALYTYGEHSPATEIPYLEMLMPALTEEQFSLWFDAGSQIPSTEYITYSCTKIQTEELTFDMSTQNNPQLVTNGFWKPGHRMLIEVEGTYADSDLANVVGDGMYFHNTSTGVKTFSTLVFATSGVTNPTEAQVPFSANHKYAFTLDKTRGSVAAAVTIGRDNGSMNLPNVSGLVTVKITDLGEY